MTTLYLASTLCCCCFVVSGGIEGIHTNAASDSEHREEERVEKRDGLIPKSRVHPPVQLSNLPRANSLPCPFSNDVDHEIVYDVSFDPSLMV